MRDPHRPAWLPWQPREVLAALARTDVQPHAAAVLLVLGAEGSTPAKAGTKALLLSDRTLVGTVGGGLVEAEACRRALEAGQRQQAEVVQMSLHGPPGPVCGGRMRILIDPLPQRHRGAWAQAAACLEQHSAGLLFTRVVHGTATEVEVSFLGLPDLERWTGWPPIEELRSVMAAEQPRLFAGAAGSGLPGEVLVEPLLPAPRLVIAGAGHVGQAVAAVAHLVGMDVVVIDDRPEFAHPQRFPPETQVRLGPIAQELAGLDLDAATYVVIVTRNHRLDAEALGACLGRPAAYIGMIGSRRKVAEVRDQLLAEGRTSPEEFDWVHAPIGLDLGAVTVPEIAVSIIAEIIAARRRRTRP